MNRSDILRYWKEALLGFGVALAIFLSYRLMNPLPLFIALSSGFLAYFLLERQGIGQSGGFGDYDAPAAFSFDDIGGQAVAKRELIEALDFMTHSAATAELGIRPLKGILLCGPPGTGKTLLAKAAAAYTDSVYLTCSGSDFIEVYAGVGAGRVRSLFKRAREQAKKQGKSGAIIFVDEIDVLGAKRGGDRGHLEYEQTLNALLVEMDGLKADDPIRVLLMGATNRPDLLDAALLRPGRFDRQIQVDLPDREGRKHILEIHMRNKPMARDVDLEAVARETIGFSGAQLESVANEAAILALRAGDKEIGGNQLKDSIEKVLIGEAGDRKALEEELWRVSVHETAHALLSEWERPGSVARLTISPRGRALGYLRQVPPEEKVLETYSDMIGGIRVALAGLAAEQLVFGEGSSGARQDLANASQLSLRIILSGLSDLGPVDGNEIPETVRFRELGKIMKREQEFVAEALRLHRDLLEGIARHLREKETLSGEEFRAQAQGFAETA
ncbi:AAA family ATPase [Heliobacterium gestii]|uniref:AAA family ATPase n=1 Tax=Heliomicrobium gestii TaxID=2699 RepID=A0A845LGM4_HELGE|nr:AAA family ATPase [Heliomicrobium gestii]MBM7867184.1 vesicle-fusing ATPase [Heliomicrobium gestii]MZP43739.1 AAA family ATPase [Heliomicrobium gestii]